MTNRKAALAKFAAVYAAYLAFAVKDMDNQTKHLDTKNAVAVILDEADYLAGKVAA
jgi:hypothetical protein